MIFSVVVNFHENQRQRREEKRSGMRRDDEMNRCRNGDGRSGRMRMLREQKKGKTEE
jgi:hypothetical protein